MLDVRACEPKWNDPSRIGIILTNHAHVIQSKVTPECFSIPKHFSLVSHVHDVAIR